MFVNKVRKQNAAFACSITKRRSHHITSKDKTRQDIDIEKNGELLLLKMVCSRMDVKV